jgi:hypothetical protein
MAQITIKVANATKAQLEQYATNVLGLELKDGEHHNALRARVGSLVESGEFKLDEPEPSQQVATPAQNAQVAGDAAKVTLVIEISDDPGGAEPVPVSVNGRNMWITRGEPVSIPVPYYEVLKGAVKHVHDVQKDGSMNPLPRLVPMYPFREIGAAA